MTNTDSPRQRKLRSHMNAARAFDLAGDMEEPLADLRRVAKTLWILIGSPGKKDTTDTLYLLANVVDEAAKRAEELRCEIWRGTWGYRFPTREQGKTAQE